SLAVLGEDRTSSRSPVGGACVSTMPAQVGAIAGAAATTAATNATPQPAAGTTVTLTVVDENGAAVPSAQVEVQEPGAAAVRVSTDFAGHATYRVGQAYRLQVRKAGFYESTLQEGDPETPEVRLVLAHEQMVVQQVNVSASAPEIDTQQISDKQTLALPEIINIPYPTSRDIRNLLQYFPGVVQDQY